jgi:rod shape-determining protein MreD
VGFAAGVAIDVLLTTPLGLSALVYTMVGYTVGSVSGGVVRRSWWIGPAVVAVASAAAMVLYALVGTVVGQDALAGPPLSAILVVVAAVNTVLAPAALRAMRWARTDERDRRHHPFFVR